MDYKKILSKAKKNLNNFKDWKENNHSFYINEQAEILRIVKHSFRWKSSNEFTNFVLNFFGAYYEKTYFVNTYLRGAVLSIPIILNDSRKYLLRGV